MITTRDHPTKTRQASQHYLIMTTPAQLRSLWCAPWCATALRGPLSIDLRRALEAASALELVEARHLCCIAVFTSAGCPESCRLAKPPGRRCSVVLRRRLATRRACCPYPAQQPPRPPLRLGGRGREQPAWTASRGPWQSSAPPGSQPWRAGLVTRH